MRARRPNKTKVKRKAKNLNNISFAGVHKLVQQSWDKTKTLRQNYQKMGLVSSVGGSAGGSGMEAEEYRTDRGLKEALKVNVEYRSSIDDIAEKQQVEPQPVYIEEPVLIAANALNIGVKVNKKRMIDQTILPATDIILALEEEAANVVAIPRPQSSHEQLIYQELVAKWGHDYSAMARDIKLNVFQLSPGQLKKKMARPLSR